MCDPCPDTPRNMYQGCTYTCWTVRFVSGIKVTDVPVCTKVVRTYVGQYVLYLEYNGHIRLYDRYPSLAQTKNNVGELSKLIT